MMDSNRKAVGASDRPDVGSPMQFSDHVECNGIKFSKAAVNLGLKGIVSKRATSLYRGRPSRNWLKIKNLVESEFVLLGTEVDDSGIPWTRLAREQNGDLEFAAPAIISTPSHTRAE